MRQGMVPACTMAQAQRVVRSSCIYSQHIGLHFAQHPMSDVFNCMLYWMEAANDKLARTTAWLEEEKVRAEALLYRMSGLIACFPCEPGEQHAAAASLAECQTQVQEHLGTTASATRGTGSFSRQSSAQGKPRYEQLLFNKLPPVSLLLFLLWLVESVFVFDSRALGAV